jgi:hypothetical protein
MGGKDEESCVHCVSNGYCFGLGGNMGLALLWPSGVVTGSNTLYVTFSTMWSSSATSTSNSVSSNSTILIPCCGASFVAVGSLTNARRHSNSVF